MGRKVGGGCAGWGSAHCAQRVELCPGVGAGCAPQVGERVRDGRLAGTTTTARDVHRVELATKRGATASAMVNERKGDVTLSST